jgi:hypothetical protein
LFHEQLRLGAPFKPYFGLSGTTTLDAVFFDRALALWRDLRFPARVLFPLAEEQGGEAGLHPVVMEEGQQAVNPPGDG